MRVELRTPAFSNLRPPAEVSWDPREQAWCVTRYADIQRLLRSGDLAMVEPAPWLARLSERAGTSLEHLMGALSGSPLFQNGAAHQATRATTRPFVAALTARFTSTELDALIAPLLDGLAGNETVDVQRAFASAMPNRIAAAALGMNEDDIRFARACWTEIAVAVRPLTRMREYERLQSLASEMHSRLTKSPRCPAARIELTPAPTVPLAYLELFLIIAATETTAGVLGSAIHVLAEQPELQELLRREPASIGAFVDEMLRLAGSLRRLTRRVLTRDLELDGKRLAAGSGVLLFVESAHRDPAAFADPQVLDLSRQGPPLLAFGAGEHACMGPALAVTEIRHGLERLLQRFAVEPAAAPWTLSPNQDLRAFDSLPILLRPLTPARPDLLPPRFLVWRADF
jgi:cytochrome P450